ncbi:MAG TPA: lipopolysaccharide kinase InaA family protein [Gemmataceae bacterium]|nr:lipopolysaccharide kinase InaA family protein [Gemmataceae bacterium]
MAEWIWQRLVRGCRRVWQHDDWARVLPADWVERIMTVDVTDRFHAKQGRSTGRWIVENERGKLAVYLKRHYRLPWWQGLLAALWPSGGWSPAEQERRRLAWAAQHGLQVPRVMASAEFIGPGAQLQSVLAVEELAGMLPLNEAIPLAAKRKGRREFEQWKRGLTLEVARLTKILHRQRHFHKDLYLCHFYIPEAFTRTMPTWTDQVYMIDFHRLAAHPFTWPVWQVKDLAELLYSSAVEGVGPRDRLRFWRHFLAERSGMAASLLRLLILAKWRRYRTHNAKRQSRAKAISPLPSKRSA